MAEKVAIVVNPDTYGDEIKKKIIEDVVPMMRELGFDVVAIDTYPRKPVRAKLSPDGLLEL